MVLLNAGDIDKLYLNPSGIAARGMISQLNQMDHQWILLAG